MMTLDELIEMLEEQRESYGGDTRVFVAQQPSWPLVATIANVWNPADDPDTVDEDGDAIDLSPVVWIATNDGAEYNGSPYAPKMAWG